MKPRSVQSLPERCAEMCAAAIGKTLSVKLRREQAISADRRTITGAIVEAKFAYWKTGCSRDTAVFQVVIEAGVSKTRRIVHVTRWQLYT